MDAETGDPVANALVEWVEGSRVLFEISDQQGRVTLNASVNLPVLVSVRHLNYYFFSDSIFNFDQTLQLKSQGHFLDEIVITGQFVPQSASRSVYLVKTLDRQEIEAYNPRDLSDVFFHQLNFRPNNDVRQGITSFSLQGISGNNLLIMIDGVPVNGRTSDDFDFGQISPEQIDRIEIVEGPMAVLYGSNAMAGVVNLITNRTITKGWNLRARIHEESVGTNFGWNKGTHNLSLQGSYGFSNLPLQLGAGLSRNLFHGHKGNITSRAMLWKPKEQWIGNVNISYRPGLWDLSYRLDFLDDMILAPGEPVGTVRRIALDDTFHSRRFISQFQAGRVLENFGRFETILSHTDYRREKVQMAVNLNTGSSQLSTAEGAQDMTSLFAYQNRSLLSYLPGVNYSVQVGYDISYEQIQGGRLIDGHDRSIFEIATFLSMEYRVTDNFKIRPGIRYTHNNMHSSPLIPSLNAKIDVGTNLGFRFGYGMGYRAPSLREMYFEFFDSNHRIIGNENLIPERGHHYSISLTNRSLSISGNPLVISLNGFFNTIRDQITYGRSNQNIQITTLINQSRFKSKGFSIGASFQPGQFDVNTSFSYTGRRNILSAKAEDVGYLFTPELGVNLGFHSRNRVWSTRLNYKFYGKQPVYGIDIEDDFQEARLSSIDPFHWMDLSVGRVLGDQFRLSAGLRNILNVTDVNSTPAVGSIHPTGDVDYISYGRSFFMTLNYSLK